MIGPTIILGDVAEGTKWWSAAHFIKVELERIYAQNNAFMQTWKFLTADVKVHAVMRAGAAWAFIYVDKANPFITYWYSTSIISRVPRGAIYINKPGSATAPFIPLGETDLINSLVGTGLKYPRVFDQIKEDKGGALVFNTDYELAGTYKATSFTGSRSIVTTDLGLPPGNALTSTGNCTVDGFYSNTHSFVTSVNQTTFGSSCIGYLDKIVGAELTNKIKIDFAFSPLKLDITAYHDDLGEVMLNLAADLLPYTFINNPRFMYLHLAPDASFLSAGILIQSGFGDDDESIYTLIDIVIKLDANGMWADSISESITYDISNDMSLAVDTPNKHDYRTHIDAGKSISIKTFKFSNSVIQNTVRTPYTLGTFAYHDMHCIVTDRDWTDPNPPNATFTIINSGVLRPGSYEADLEALSNYPVTGSSYLYNSTRTSCFTNATIGVDISSEFGEPRQASVQIEQIANGLTITLASSRPLSGATRTETYTPVVRGSPVFGVLYDGSQYEDGHYIRHFVDGKLKAKNKDGSDVIGSLQYSEDTTAILVAVWQGTGANKSDMVIDAGITLYDPADNVTLSAIGAHRSKIGMVNTDARFVNEMSISGIVIANPRVGGITRFPLDTSENSLEQKFDLDWAPNPALPNRYVPIYPYCANITKGTTTAPTSDLFGNILTSDSQSDFCYIIKSTDAIDIMTTKPTVIDFNKIINATLTGDNVAKFPNGYQIVDADFQRYNKSIIEHSAYGSGIINNIGISPDNITTTSAPGSNPALPDPLLGGTTTSNSTTSVLDGIIQVFFSGSSPRGFFHQFASGDYVASAETLFGSSYPNKSYFVILNGSQMPDLQNITNFNSFTTSSRFGIGFSI